MNLKKANLEEIFIELAENEAKPAEDEAEEAAPSDGSEASPDSAMKEEDKK